MANSLLELNTLKDPDSGKTVNIDDISDNTTKLDDLDSEVRNGDFTAPFNKISVSQMVVEGATGQPLPENGTLTPYAIGNEMALGWVVTEAVVDGTKDANGNVTATSGKVRYTINKDEKGLIGVAQLFGSVMQSDGTNLTQVYADGSGIILGEDATTVWLEIDFSQSIGFFYVAGISEHRGRLEAIAIGSEPIITRNVLSPDGGIADNLLPVTSSAWVNFDGSSDIIRSSYNVSSITDNGSGDKTVNFESSIDNTDFAVFVWGGTQSSSGTTDTPADYVRNVNNYRFRYFSAAIAVDDGNMNLLILST